MSQLLLPDLFLNKREERRIRSGHLWVYSNEVNVKRSPLKELETGQLVNVKNHQGNIMGSGYVNPSTLIAVRLVSREADCDLNEDWFTRRLSRALSLRENYFSAPCYRLCHSEGDWLPGLIVDRFGDTLVAQCNTAGLNTRREIISSALHKLCQPTGILWRNDNGARKLEGLPLEDEVEGEVPDIVELTENGLRFQVDLRAGQKTGWYYDHRENRAWTAQWVKDASVLDVFSYAGAWSVLAAQSGASEVMAVDASEPALQTLKQNMSLNQVRTPYLTLQGDAFARLKDLKDQERQFDVVIVDPPAFIKRRKDAQAGQQAYYRINQMAMALLKPGGMLVSASCSHHFSLDQLRQTVTNACQGLKRDIQIVRESYHAVDHPIHPAMPETRYLKTLFTRIF